MDQTRECPLCAKSGRSSAPTDDPVTLRLVALDAVEPLVHQILDQLGAGGLILDQDHRCAMCLRQTLHGAPAPHNVGAQFEASRDQTLGNDGTS